MNGTQVKYRSRGRQLAGVVEERSQRMKVDGNDHWTLEK